ncbi:hypothetical protein AC1031_003206 [Aphanomyces cochlioides]|nr:hypothetical protein AC1031_003206 [Aphanomyces cochlioides]
MDAIFEIQVAVHGRQTWHEARFNLADDNMLHVAVADTHVCSIPLGDASVDILSDHTTYLLRQVDRPIQLLFRSPKNATRDTFMLALRSCLTTAYWSVTRRTCDIDVQWINSTDAWHRRQLVLWGNTISIFDKYTCEEKFNACQCSLEQVTHRGRMFEFRKDDTPIFRFRCPETAKRTAFLTAMHKAINSPPHRVISDKNTSFECPAATPPVAAS